VDSQPQADALKISIPMAIANSNLNLRPSVVSIIEQLLEEVSLHKDLVPLFG
jgi:hypothetical protein